MRFSSLAVGNGHSSLPYVSSGRPSPIPFRWFLPMHVMRGALLNARGRPSAHFQGSLSERLFLLQCSALQTPAALVSPDFVLFQLRVGLALLGSSSFPPCSVHLICFPFLRGHCRLLPHVYFLGNHCFIHLSCFREESKLVIFTPSWWK